MAVLSTLEIPFLVDALIEDFLYTHVELSRRTEGRVRREQVSTGTCIFPSAREVTTDMVWSVGYLRQTYPHEVPTQSQNSHFDADRRRGQ